MPRKYRGATCITPNRYEAALATGRDADDADEASVVGLGRQLIKDLKLDTLVLTLDRQGLLLMRKGGKPGKSYAVKAVITIDELGLTHQVNGEIEGGE